jgi:hypothetical protein
MNVSSHRYRTIERQDSAEAKGQQSGLALDFRTT